MRQGERQCHLGPLPLAQVLDLAIRWKFVLLDGCSIPIDKPFGEEGGCEPTDFADGHPVVERRCIGDITDPLPDLQRILFLARIQIEHAARPCRRLLKAGQDADDGGLASTVFTEQRVYRSGLHGKVDAAQSFATAKAHFETFDFDDIIHGIHLWVSKDKAEEFECGSCKRYLQG